MKSKLASLKKESLADVSAGYKYYIRWDGKKLVVPSSEEEYECMHSNREDVEATIRILRRMGVLIDIEELYEKVLIAHGFTLSD